MEHKKAKSARLEQVHFDKEMSILNISRVKHPKLSFYKVTRIMWWMLKIRYHGQFIYGNWDNITVATAYQEIDARYRVIF